MRIFDCFTFYNEFDILELRLQELWDTVDYFVIAEATHTHQSNPKPLYLQEQWARFQPYAEKIRHVIVDDMPCNTDTWINERHQRRALSRGLADLTAQDIVCVSDCDEIPRAEVLAQIAQDINDYDRYVLAITLNYFRLNYMMINPVFKQNNIIVTRGRVFTDPQQERALTFNLSNLPLHYAQHDFCVIEHGGWHFTYFGQTEFAINKIKNFAHAETNVPEILDNLNVDQMIKQRVGLAGINYHERFEYVQVDDYFPSTVVNNLDKWQHMIVPGATCTVYDFYPE
jgi:hypothetical protein